MIRLVSYETLSPLLEYHLTCISSVLGPFVSDVYPGAPHSVADCSLKIVFCCGLRQKAYLYTSSLNLGIRNNK